MEKRKRIICPTCKGTRIIWGIDKSDHTRMQVLCDFCAGEGIVIRIKSFEYKKIN